MLHRLRRDPMAAALLLMRCPCQDYEAALASCDSCEGGPRAVTDQLLQLLRASAGSGGPHKAPPPLLHAMLCAASARGDTVRVCTLLALPYPPDVDGGGGRALRLAVEGSPHLHTLLALLHGGADPTAGGLHLIAAAAESPSRIGALTFLLGACKDLPEPAREDTFMVDMASALHHNNTAHLPAIPWPRNLQEKWRVLIDHTVLCGSLARLRLYLDLQYISSQAQLDRCLRDATSYGGRVAQAPLLLEHGARARGSRSCALLFAVAPRELPLPEKNRDQRDMVRLLLRHGADLRDALVLAEECEQPDLAALLLDTVREA